MLRGLLFCALLALPVSAHAESLRFVNGHWYEDGEFVRREYFAVDGVMRTEYEGSASIVDLGGAWAVPGFGNAHTHGIGNREFTAESERFLRTGVFYVANPNSLASSNQAARHALAGPETVDARFANGGLTSSGGHPIQIFEKKPGESEMAGNAYWAIDDEAMLEAKWDAILATGPDFLKIYLEVSEFHEERKNDPAFYGKRGLDPALVPSIVERAHASGLRVAAHVTSRDDWRVAIEAGVDEIAHLPLEPLTEADARLAAEHGTAIVTTALSHRPAPLVADLDALHQANLALLRDAGAKLVLGTDSQATVVDEVVKLESLGMDRAELVRMLVVDTPAYLFPDRELALREGSEASFVVLEANPLEELAALRQVDARFKQGHRIAIEDPDELPGIGQQLVHTLMAQGPDAAVAKYHQLRAEEPDAWDFSEGQLNALGYAMIQHGKAEAAIAIFELNSEQFPESSNVWDSLGDAYSEVGRNEEAAQSYRKALEINPGNHGSREKLEALG